MICTAIGILSKTFIPSQVDQAKEKNTVYSDELTYTFLLSNKKILFACLCVFFSLLQFTYVDPLLASYMHEHFGVKYATSGYFFLALGLGYTISGLLVSSTVKFIKPMKVMILASVCLGFCTMSYGESSILKIPSSRITLGIALLFGGFFNSHMMVPALDEMISEGQVLISPASTRRIIRFYNI